MLFAIVISAISLTVNSQSAEVNIYSARKESLIKPLLDQFSAETGIKTNLITASADKLLTRMINEGRNTPADILITVDAGRLYRARQADIFQPIKSQKIEQLVPSNLRDAENYWIGLSQRARVIFYVKESVNPGPNSNNTSPGLIVSFRTRSRKRFPCLETPSRVIPWRVSRRKS